MTSNQSHRRYLTVQKAVDDVLGSTGSEEKDIVILQLAQSDASATYVDAYGDAKADSHPYLALLEPIALFQSLFNEEICSLIACETERYTSQRNEVIHLTAQEIEAFVGNLLLTGYNS